jgi:hypothetical protein
MEMTAKVRVQVSADRAWQTLGTRFGDIAQWASPIKMSSLDVAAPRAGAVRTCHVGGFGPLGRMVVQERLLQYDDGARQLTYDALAGLPAFIQRATSRWSVTDDGPKACLVECRAALSLAWWIWPLAPLMVARLRRDATGVLEELTHTLETGHPHPRTVAARTGERGSNAEHPEPGRAPTVG